MIIFKSSKFVADENEFLVFVCVFQKNPNQKVNGQLVDEISLHSSLWWPFLPRCIFEVILNDKCHD